MQESRHQFVSVLKFSVTLERSQACWVHSHVVKPSTIHCLSRAGFGLTFNT